MNQPGYPLVAVVLLNYRRAGDTLECVRALERCGYQSLKLVVVDNGSGDDSERLFRASFPDHDVVQTGTNLGFAAGNNVGIRHAMQLNPAYILILNNDTEVSAGFLEPLVDAMERTPDAAAATGTIYLHSDPDRIWYGGGRIIPWRASGFSDHLNERLRPEELGDVRPVSFMSGCMMLLRSSVLRAVGAFDARYFMYVEDVEFCSRLARAGHRLLYVPGSTIRHKVGSSDLRPYALYYMVRNRLLFLRGWSSPLQRWAGMAYLHVTMLAKSIVWSFGRPELRRAVRAGIADYHRGRFNEGRGLNLI